MSECRCIGHLTGKVPTGGGLVKFRWVVDVPDPTCTAHTKEQP